MGWTTLRRPIRPSACRRFPESWYKNRIGASVGSGELIATTAVNAQQDAKIQLQVIESIAKRFEGQAHMDPKLEALAEEKASEEAALAK